MFGRMLENKITKGYRNMSTTRKLASVSDLTIEELTTLIESTVKQASTHEVEKSSKRAVDMGLDVAKDHFKEGLFEELKEPVYKRIKELLFMVIGSIVSFLLANILISIALLFIIVMAVVAYMVIRHMHKTTRH